MFVSNIYFISQYSLHELLFKSGDDLIPLWHTHWYFTDSFIAQSIYWKQKEFFEKLCF